MWNAFRQCRFNLVHQLLIEHITLGDSQGKGLGLRFLRHIERNSLLLFMVPADSDDIRKEYEVLLNELRTFNPEMLDKQRVLASTFDNTRYVRHHKGFSTVIGNDAQVGFECSKRVIGEQRT